MSMLNIPGHPDVADEELRRKFILENLAYFAGFALAKNYGLINDFAKENPQMYKDFLLGVKT